MATLEFYDNKTERFVIEFKLTEEQIQTLEPYIKNPCGNIRPYCNAKIRYMVVFLDEMGEE